MDDDGGGGVDDDDGSIKDLTSTGPGHHGNEDSGNSAEVTPQQPPAAAAPAPPAAVSNEAAEAALLARLARCGTDLRLAAAAGDPVAAVTALGALDALGNVEQRISSIEGLGATRVIQALRRLKKQETYGQADATHAINQATTIFERLKAALSDIRDRSNARPAKAERLKEGVEALRVPPSFRGPLPSVTCCAEIKFMEPSSAATPSTRHLLDGVAVWVSHDAIQPAGPRRRREMT